MSGNHYWLGMAHCYALIVCLAKTAVSAARVLKPVSERSHQIDPTGITIPDNQHIKCGELVTDDPDPQGRIRGAFEYSKGYLKHPAAFDLDPVSLKRGIAEIPAERPQGIHAVFEDALPDDWRDRNLLFIKESIEIPKSFQKVKIIDSP